jgi:tRNA A-37 threonylcarbamoyl transferase component Bud32
VSGEDTTSLAIQQAQRQLLPHPSDHVIKVEVTSKLDIQIQCSINGLDYWFAWQGGELKPLRPSEDRKLALATRLGDPEFRKNLSVLAYRPGKRITLLEYGSRRHRVLKGVRKGRLSRLVQNYELANHALGGGIIAPEVLDYDDSLELLYMSVIEGESLRIYQNGHEFFQLVGHAFRDFQDFPGLENRETFTAEKELSVIENRAQRLEMVGATLPEGWSELRDRLAKNLTKLPPAQLCLAHRDLHDGQFVQRTSNLALIDFDLMTKADTALDVANFLAHLTLRELQQSRGVSKQLADDVGMSLLAGLGRNADPGFWPRLRYYEATTFARLALVYLVRPRWRHVVSDLVTLSQRCLDDFEKFMEF